MRMRSIHIGSDFGFIALQDGDYREGYFFHSKGQGREIISKVTDVGEVRIVNSDILSSVLPKHSMNNTVSIVGTAAETLTRLMTPIAEISQGNSVDMIVETKRGPFLYFLLTPPTQVKDEKDALVGLCDDDGNHFVFIVYSKQQAREILRSHLKILNTEKIIARAHWVVDGSLLPSESNKSQIRIGEPMAAFLNTGYALMRHDQAP